MGLALLIGTAFSLVGVLVVARFMPARDVVPTTEEVRLDEMPITGDLVPVPVPVRVDE